MHGQKSVPKRIFLDPNAIHWLATQWVNAKLAKLRHAEFVKPWRPICQVAPSGRSTPMHTKLATVTNML
ncbi:hypothetical protein MHY01S_28460 [Meiothermus hypogaeus NBRC 106114]|uniref:Uncharacterized protein n=1 Tax=Meiothermus hypogaeus NBRC 106114 TaxID=1227553 RepID=A0A511R4Z4_9DEIN|nr:hypothetical protein MHY01S_28460 [Meiothermus hypogaeus NBRC 106114]